jgi:hypothetical protein
MIKVYFMTAWAGGGHLYEFDKEIAEIKSINPDKIIAWSSEEYDVFFIFNNFFEKIQPWLEQNDKFVDVVSTCEINNVPFKRARVEPHYGFLINYMMYHAHSSTSCNSNSLIFKSIPTNWHDYNQRFGILYNCYNRRGCDERALLVDSLVEHDLFRYGSLTYHEPEKYLDWKYHDGSQLLDEPDFQMHTLVKFSPNEFAENFHNSFFDVVTESRYDPGEFFMTEKTLKSIMAFKPFIVLSCSDYHRYLTDVIGLELYDEIFDYKFDSAPNINDRVLGIVNNVKNLSNTNLSLRIQLYRTMISKLVRNKNRIIDLFFNKDKMVPACMKFLLEKQEYQMFGHPPLLISYLNFIGIRQ